MLSVAIVGRSGIAVLTESARVVANPIAPRTGLGTRALVPLRTQTYVDRRVNRPRLPRRDIRHGVRGLRTGSGDCRHRQALRRSSAPGTRSAVAVAFAHADSARPAVGDEGDHPAQHDDDLLCPCRQRHGPPLMAHSGDDARRQRPLRRSRFRSLGSLGATGSRAWWRWRTRCRWR